MALRFYNEHATYSASDPLTWRIEIHDSAFVGDAYEFRIASESCTIQWRAEGDDINAPILASSCEFTMMVQDATHEDLITDLAAAKEGRFTVVVYRDSVFHWAGVINSPEISFDDADYPYDFTITAVDGLALLKNYPCSQGGHRWEDVYEDQSELVVIIARSLKKLPHVVTHFEGSTKFIVTAINWYSTLHDDPVTDVYDPFFYTFLDNRAFAQGQASGAAKFASCYEAISAILTAFNARISLQDGYFLIEQLEHRAATIGSAGNYSRYYDYDITAPTANTLDDAQPIGNTEDVKKLRGGTYSFLPALRNARVTQTLNGLQNLIPAYECSSAAPATYAVGTIFADGLNTYVRFTATVEFVIENGAITPAPHLAVFELRIEIGGVKVALREASALYADTWVYDPLSWSTSLGDRIDFVVKITAPAIGETGTFVADINLLFPTPFDFTQGDLVVGFDFADLYFGGAAVSGSDYGITWVLKNSYLDIITALTPYAAKAVTYEVVGDEDNTQTTEIKTIIGDKDSPIMNQWGGLLFFDDPDYFYTELWGNLDNTRDRTIAQLLAQRIVAASYFPRKILRGTAVGSPFVVQTPIEERGEVYLLKGGTYNTARDEMAGEWVRLAYTSAEFTYEDPLYDTGEYEATTPGGGTGGGGAPIDTGGGGSGTGTADGNGIYSGSGNVPNGTTATLDGSFTILGGSTDVLTVTVGAAQLYLDNTTGQITFNDGGNSHSIGLTASGILINAPSATADNIFVRAAGALVKLQDIGGNVQVGGGTTESEIRLLEASANGTNYVAVKPPASLSANVTLVLPPTSGTANQILGQNSGATGTEYKTVNGTTNQITVTHGANSITLSTPQNIHTAATPTFASLTLTNDLTVNDDISMTGGGLQTFSMSGGTLNSFQMNGPSTMQIGNTSADAQFYVSGQYGGMAVQPTSSDNNIILQKFSASGATVADGQNLMLDINDGAALSNGHYLGSICFRSRATSSTLQTGGQISAIADGSDWTNTSLPTKLVFKVVPTSSAVLSEIMTVKSAGVDLTGNLSLTTAGNKINVATGSNASAGISSAMTAGTITINTTAVTANSIIMLTRNTAGGTVGSLEAPTGSIVAGTSFVINSSSNTDTSTVNWWIIN